MKNKKKFVEGKVIVDTMGIKFSDLKSVLFFVLDFNGFPCNPGVGKGRRPSCVG